MPASASPNMAKSPTIDNNKQPNAAKEFTLTLKSGDKMPAVGFGCWKLGANAENIVSDAILVRTPFYLLLRDF